MWFLNCIENCLCYFTLSHWISTPQPSPRRFETKESAGDRLCVFYFGRYSKQWLNQCSKRYLDNIWAGYCSHSILNVTVTVAAFFVVSCSWFFYYFLCTVFFGYFSIISLSLWFYFHFTLYSRLHNSGIFFCTQKGMSNSNKTGVMTREMAEKRVININSNLNIWILCWIFQYFMCSVLRLQVWRFLKATFIFIPTSFLICQ